MSCNIDVHITAKYDIRKRIGKGVMDRSVFRIWLENSDALHKLQLSAIFKRYSSDYDLHLAAVRFQAYGIVWKCVDRKTGEIVALKKIFDAFTNPTDAQRTYREIMFLQEFSAHRNVIQLLKVIKAKNDIDIYLVFEFMDTDLHAVIKAGILVPIHHQYIMYQLFNVIMYIHSGNCIHRDLKPSNILLNADCFIKLADFGLARSLVTHVKDSKTSTKPAMTDYVATRWYRAPEILLGSNRYTKGVDMWSLGCILAEMIAGNPLFPGTSTVNQIDMIMQCIPQPNQKDIEGINSPYAKSILDRFVPSEAIPHQMNFNPHERKGHIAFPDVLSAASPEALDIISRMLQFNPDNRSTAKECLQHRYVSRFHDRKMELELNEDVIPCLNDNVQLKVEAYRDELYENVLEKRKTLIEARSQIKATSEQAGQEPENVENKEESVQGTPLHCQHQEQIARSTSTGSSRSPSTPQKKPSKPTPPTSERTFSSSYNPINHHYQHQQQRTFFGRQKPLHDQKAATAGDESNFSPHHYHSRAAHSATIITRPVITHTRQTCHSSFMAARAGQRTTTESSVKDAQKHVHSSQGDTSNLIVTSAQIIPSARPQNKCAARGVPTKFASGAYTQTHGTISSSDLARLKENIW